MTVRKTSRRMFLLGAAGSAFAIPFLPSILGRGSKAEAQPDRPRTFISLRTAHGGVVPSEFFPERSLLDQTTSMGALPWDARFGRVTPQQSGDQTFFSPILGASSLALTPRIQSVMNAYLGLDYSVYAGHNVGFHLGAYATKLAQSSDFLNVDHWGPTIDQLIAYSPTFYHQADAGPLASNPIVRMGTSVGHAQPGSPGTPMAVFRRREDDALGVWRELFEPSGRILASDPEAERLLRLDAFNDAHGAYQRLLSRASQPGGRLSRLDRERVERHMSELASLRARMEAASMCDVPEQPAASNVRQRFLDLAAMARAAVECGLSRVFVFDASSFSLLPTEAFGGRGTHDFAHAAAASTNSVTEFGESYAESSRGYWVQWYQQIFEHAVLPMVHALDFEDEMGRNVLDHSLVQWASECGMETHASVSVPLVTFGALDGAFQTGYFVDYRSDEDWQNVSYRDERLQPDWKRGILYDQYLGAVLRGFDVPEETYDRYRLRPADARGATSGDEVSGPAQIGGYGAYHISHAGRDFYHDAAVHEFANNPLPAVQNG